MYCDNVYVRCITVYITTNVKFQLSTKLYLIVNEWEISKPNTDKHTDKHTYTQQVRLI